MQYSNISKDRLARYIKTVPSDKYIRVVERMVRYNWVFMRERWWDLDTMPIDPINACILDDIFRASTIAHIVDLSFSILAWMIMKKMNKSSKWYLYSATVNGTRGVYAMSIVDRQVVTILDNDVVTVEYPVPICSVEQVMLVLGEWGGFPPEDLIDEAVYIALIEEVEGVNDKDIEIAREMLTPDADLLLLAREYSSIDIAQQVIDIVLLYKETRMMNIILNVYPSELCE